MRLAVIFQSLEGSFGGLNTESNTKLTLTFMEFSKT